MVIKALNESIGPYKIVPTLLVYGAYPKMGKDSIPPSSVETRAKTIKRQIQVVKQILFQRMVKDALACRDSSNPHPNPNLKLQSEVAVWQEKIVERTVKICQV